MKKHEYPKFTKKLCDCRSDLRKVDILCTKIGKLAVKILGTQSSTSAQNLRINFDGSDEPSPRLYRCDSNSGVQVGKVSAFYVPFRAKLVDKVLRRKLRVM